MCEIRRPPGQNFFCSLSPSCCMTSSALINSCATNGVYSVRPKLLVSLFLFYFISLAEETKKKT